MKVLYIDNEYICQTVIWPPRNTVRGWELDVLCSQELLGMFPHMMTRRVFRVDDVEFTGFVTMLPAIMSESEMTKVTLVFQHCATAETDGAEGYCPPFTFGLTHRIDADI